MGGLVYDFYTLSMNIVKLGKWLNFLKTMLYSVLNEELLAIMVESDLIFRAKAALMGSAILQRVANERITKI